MTGWVSVDVALPVAAWNDNNIGPLTYYLATDGVDIHKVLLSLPLAGEGLPPRRRRRRAPAPAHDPPDLAHFMLDDCTPLKGVTHWRFMPDLPEKESL